MTEPELIDEIAPTPYIKMMLAYGLLWHSGGDLAEASAARRVLYRALSHEKRGQAIELAREFARRSGEIEKSALNLRRTLSGPTMREIMDEYP